MMPQRRRSDHQAETDLAGQRDDEQPGESADPAVGCKGVDIGAVRIQRERQAEAERAETVRKIQQHRQGSHLVARSPRVPELKAVSV